MELIFHTANQDNLQTYYIPKYTSRKELNFFTIIKYKYLSSYNFKIISH